MIGFLPVVTRRGVTQTPREESNRSRWMRDARARRLPASDRRGRDALARGRLSRPARDRRPLPRVPDVQDARTRSEKTRRRARMVRVLGRRERVDDDDLN